MLTCAATCRSRDKKPDGNKLDAVSASSVSIAELDNATYRLPDDRTIVMTKAANRQNDVLPMGNMTVNKILSSLDMTVEEYASLVDQAKLAADLYGEPEIAAFRSNADRHSGLIR